MATMLYQPTASQYASAASHLDLRAEWRTVRINGVRYVTVVSGTSGHVYFVRADAQGCECLYYAKCGGVCSHRLAVMLDALEEELRETAPVIRELRGRFEAAFPRYDEVFPSCRATDCDDDPAPRGEGYCHRHVLCDAF